MKRLAVILLAGTTMISAQTEPSPHTQQDMEQLAARLQEKLQIAINQAQTEAEQARNAAIAYQNQMKEASSYKIQEAMAHNRAQTQERLQHAITALELASEKVGSQVDEVCARIQSRLLEKKSELIKLQERIRVREQAHGNGNEADNDWGDMAETGSSTKMGGEE